MSASSGPIPTIFVVSGGIGASGEQLVHTVLAQFPVDSVSVVTIGNVRHTDQIMEVVSEAQKIDAMIVYTIVDSDLHDDLLEESNRNHVQAVDLMGPIMQWVSEKVGREPAGQPGLYRKLHREYFDRIAAIDFTMAHDDGKSPDGWPQAEAVLVGVSRVGKTPLSLYLAVLGWKIANYPLVPQLPIPEKLFKLDPRRVIGLTVDPDQLLQYRLRRQGQLGVRGPSDYTDPQTVFDEVREAVKLFRQNGFTIVNMTDKTIELGADEIIRHLS